MRRRDRLRHVADRLDRFARIDTDGLASQVGRAGACLILLVTGTRSDVAGLVASDRAVAARLCAGCPVQEACLELELRWSGPVQTGVFGALPAEDRRDLYPIWRARRIENRGDR